MHNLICVGNVIPKFSCICNVEVQNYLSRLMAN